MRKIIVALVGRSNVGKSTLFNRLSVKKKALVYDTPGVTRDRKYSDAKIGPMQFTVVDTPGLEQAQEGALEYYMMQQTMISIVEADIVCLIVDQKIGVTVTDKLFAGVVRKKAKQCILLVNKAEQQFTYDQAYYQLGCGTPIPISAEHGHGIVDLYDAIASLQDTVVHSDNTITDPIVSDNIQIVIAGRPNAGKSTFINTILGSQRMLTGSEAGITRESIEISWQYKGYNVKLIDTAGLNKRANITERLEKISTSDTIYSIKFANTVILMIDAIIAFEQQDLNIANYIIDQGRSLILAINKWDLVHKKKDYKKELKYKLETQLSQIRGVSVVYLSSLHNNNTLDVMDACINAYTLWNKKITTSKLNDWLTIVLKQHPLPTNRKLGRRIRIKYITQTKTRPPVFKLFTNAPTSITATYKQYLVNSLRVHFSIPGIPIRLDFVKSYNPYIKYK